MRERAYVGSESLLLVVDGGRVLGVGRILEDDLRSRRDILGEPKDGNRGEIRQRRKAALLHELPTPKARSQ